MSQAEQLKRLRDRGRKVLESRDPGLATIAGEDYACAVVRTGGRVTESMARAGGVSQQERGSLLIEKAILAAENVPQTGRAISVNGIEYTVEEVFGYDSSKASWLIRYELK